VTTCPVCKTALEAQPIAVTALRTLVWCERCRLLVDTGTHVPAPGTEAEAAA
jgi:hypothetical protein